MKGYVTNIEKLTLENTNFREVIYTDKNCQLVLMSLLSKQDIGEEVHDVDQFLRIEKGSGKVILNNESHDFNDGYAIIVPAGVKHNIINSSDLDMKIYTIYTPPHHKDGTIHKTKADAENDKSDFFDINLYK